jgi:CxxC-x17-CxxC domain-containing protein
MIIGNLLFKYSSQQIEVIVTYQKLMIEVKCTDCGNTATVPFKPTPGKPVYCRTCFSKHVTKRSESAGSNNEGFAPKQAWAREETTGKQRKRKRLSVFSNAARIVSEIERICAAALPACGLRQICEE